MLLQGITMTFNIGIFDLNLVKITMHAYKEMKNEGWIKQDLFDSIKKGKLVKAPEKEGAIGVIESKKVRLIFTIRQKIMYVITVERK